MLELLSLFTLAQATPAPETPSITPQESIVTAPFSTREILRPQEVRSLPGSLDQIPVFNSNSPEVVQSPGVLLSTFPSDGMAAPSAHLNYPLEGRFDVFAHHIARGRDANDVRTLYLGMLVNNPSNRPVNIDILQASSYLSQEAPFRDLPAYVANPLGTVYAGPGSRTTSDILRGERQPGWPDHITIPPRSTQILYSLPIPLRDIDDLRNGVPLPQYLVPFPLPVSPSLESADGASALLLNASDSESATLSQPPSGPPPIGNRQPPSNGRTVIMRLSSDGPVYIASLALQAPINPDGSERSPSLSEWQSLLAQGSLAGPRDLAPTPPDRPYLSLRYFYGRVAGVAVGSQWTAQVTDSDDVDFLSIPSPGNALSYGISTLDNGTFGTGQIQSAPLLVRYPDTAYRAHGNYGVHYQITFPLQNNTDTTQSVSLLFQTPLKEPDDEGGLRFLEPPDDRIFFRGTVRLSYKNDYGIPQTQYLHLVQRRGQEGQPLIRLNMPPGDRRLVQVDFIYPPDSTPPQVLTIETGDQWSTVNNPLPSTTTPTAETTE